MKGLSVLLILFTLCTFSSPAMFQEDSLPALSPKDSRIAPNSKVYISPLENGYHIYLTAALQKKQVPMIIVVDKSKADYELSAVTETEKAGWAKMLFQKSGASAEQASIMMVDIKTGVVVFGYNVNKSNSARGMAKQGRARIFLASGKPIALLSSDSGKGIERRKYFCWIMKTKRKPPGMRRI